MKVILVCHRPVAGQALAMLGKPYEIGVHGMF
jgi:hypothetical protein